MDTYSPTVVALARQLAEQRLAFLSTFGGFVLDANGPDGSDTVSRLWAQLVDALRAETVRGLEPAILEAFRRHVEADPWSDALAADTSAHEQAGFLVGLELGRRLGGAR